MARILVVDDDLFYRTLVSGFLADMGHQVSMAVKAEQALAAISGETFDLLVVDVFMEGMDGVTLLSELTRSARRQAVGRMPVIIMTSDESLSTEQRAREAQASAFLLKPFTERVLGDAVKQALHSGH